MLTSQCNKCLDIQKRLKIVKSDYEFEIKKMQQDKSTQKALYEIHLLKQIKRLQDLYEKQKIQRQDQTRNWISKHDATIANYQQQINQMQNQHTKKLKSQVDHANRQGKQRVDKLTQKYQKTQSNLVSKYQATIKEIKQQMQNKINEITNKNEECTNNLKKNHKMTLEQKIKMYESRLLGTESEKIKQKKMHDQTKNENKQIQSKLYKQLFQLRKNVSQLQVKLNDQIKDSKLKQQNIDSLHIQIEKLKEKHALEIESVNKQNDRQLDLNREDYKAKIEQVYKQTLNYCNRYQNAISKIQQTRENQRGIYLNNIEQINVFVENRASRPEDLQEIEYLRAMLAKKIKQCECLSEQLKFNRLQLENKQQTYNKIFIPLSNPTNDTILYKRKQFKLRRQGRSVTTVRQALQCVNSINNAEKKSTTPFPPKSKIL